MYRPKPETSAKQQLPRRNPHNPQHSPKLPAKQPLPFRKKILVGQSSAHNANRNRSKNYPCVKLQTPGNKLQYLYRQKNVLSEEQIKNSAIYKLLQQQIREMAARQQTQISKLKQIKTEKEKETQNLKKEQYSVKLQIWQLKNEALQLKESIKDEKEETQRLQEELGTDPEQQEPIDISQNE